VAAFDRNARYAGKQVAVIALTGAPMFESLIDMPDSDYEAEGFRWTLDHPNVLGRTVSGVPRNEFLHFVCSWEGFESWRHSGQSMWVIRFELVGLTEEGKIQQDIIQAKMTGDIAPW
jgi:hypothetical protein